MPRAHLADSALRHVSTHVTVHVSVGAFAIARDLLGGPLRSGASPSSPKADAVHSLQHVTECGNGIVCHPPRAFSQCRTNRLRRIITSITPRQRQLLICEKFATRLWYKILETVCNKGTVILYRPLENCALLTLGSIGCAETSVRNYHYLLGNNPGRGWERKIVSKRRNKITTTRWVITRQRMGPKGCTETSVRNYLLGNNAG